MLTVGRHAHIVLSALLLTLMVFLTTKVTERNGGFDSDGVIYARMASSPAFACSDSPAPLRQRVLVPQLVRVLPGPLLDRFRAIAFAASVVSLCILYSILFRLGYSPFMCYLGVLLYAGVFWTLKFSFYSPAYIDHVSQMMLLAIIYCCIADKHSIAVCILCVSAFHKESLPLFGLFVAADLWSQGWRRGIRRTTRTAAVVVALPLACAQIAQCLSCVHGHQAFHVLVAEVGGFFRPSFWPIFLHAVFSGLGLLPVILLVQYRPSLQFLRQRPAFIVYLLVSASALFGGVDKARLFNYLLPAVVLLSLATIRSFKPPSTARVIAWTLLFVCGHWYLGNYLSPMGTFSEYLAKLVPEHAWWLGGVHHEPFLIRDCIFGVVMFVVTVQLMLGEWYFSPTIGFTRRDIAQCATSRR